jgi:hypothetical protein
MRTETIRYQVPTHWLPALINHDCSGLDNDELRQFCNFSNTEVSGVIKDGRRFLCIEYGEESYFATHHDGRPYGCLPCDVTDCDFVYMIV